MKNNNEENAFLTDMITPVQKTNPVVKKEEKRVGAATKKKGLFPSSYSHNEKKVQVQAYVNAGIEKYINDVSRKTGWTKSAVVERILAAHVVQESPNLLPDKLVNELAEEE